MSAHTKGEWKVFERLGDWDIWAPGTPCIARVMLRDVSINEQIANARLMAAAPVLLEALRETTAALAAWVEIADDEDERESDNDALNKAAAAIAAATQAIGD